MDIREELKSAGVYPTGPVSAWPQERHVSLMNFTTAQKQAEKPQQQAAKVKAGVGQMAGGLLRTAGQGLMNGKVSAEIREARYETCKACPAFIKDSKRCGDCGCFMQAKTWVGGDPKKLCPRKKWEK